MSIRFLLLVSIAVSILTLATPSSMAMEIEEEDSPKTNAITIAARQALAKLVSETDPDRTLIKIEEIDPSLIKSIHITFPQLKDEEPYLLFFLLPQSLKMKTEERPKKTEMKEKSKADLLREQLNKILSESSDIEESTALLSIKNFKANDGDQPTWDNIKTFMEELDKAFFNDILSSKKVKVAKVSFGVLGLTPPIPICAAILVSMGEIFGFPPGDWLSNSLSVWITTTVAPVSIRQLYKRAGIIFYPSPFLTLKEDEKRTNKKIQEIETQKTTELLKSKNGEGLSHQEKNRIATEAQEEVGEPYRSKPHIFEQSNIHKLTRWLLGVSSVLNGSIPASLMLTIYQRYDQEVGFPWGVVFSVPVATYYALNYYDFGTDRLWELFSYYKYIGSDQSSEEDSREKRLILIRRIEQFQEVIADAKYAKYVETVYNEILKKKKTQHIQDEQSRDEEQISAFSLLMLMDKFRLEEEMAAMNFKRDLDTIKVSPIKDFLDNLTAGIVGAGFYADVVIIRSILKDIFQGPPFYWDEVTAGEQSGFYATAFLDVSFRSVIEFKLHQNNLQSWLKVFSLKHLVDFQEVRKTLGGISFGNALLHSLPKFFVGWKAFSEHSLLTKLALLIPSTLINISLNDAVFNKHYNGLTTDIAILKTEEIDINRKRAHLKHLSDKAKEYIRTRFGDETINNIYAAIHKGV